jgi:HEPN domain-containing protein
MSRTMQELALSKSLANEAERQLERQDDFGNGLAVSLAQDAAELFLRAVARKIDATIERNGGFDKLIKAINDKAKCDKEKVIHMERLENLNKARIAFKHSGTAPSRKDAERLVRYGLEFLEAATPRFFDIEYKSISLVHEIRATVIRDLLLAATKLAEAGDYQNAMVDIATAVITTEKQLEALISPAPRSGGSIGGRLGAAIDYIDDIRLIALGALVRFDPKALVRFKGLAPKVFISVSGARTVCSSYHANYSDEDVDVSLAFATDFALATQRVLP